MKTVAIVQARMGSTRLPGKVLQDLAGQPVLARVIDRTRRANTLDEVVVATTINPSDEPIVELCRSRGLPCFRGSENDLLDRYYRAAARFSADIVVRITSDCPLIEPIIIDRVVDEYIQLAGEVDYASNTNPYRTFPRGLDTEVMPFETLAWAWKEDGDPARREHVTPYIYGNPDRFSIHLVKHEEDLSFHRWVVDTPEDLEFLRLIYDHFARDDFTWTEALTLLEQNPEWLEINRHVRQKDIGY